MNDSPSVRNVVHRVMTMYVCLLIGLASSFSMVLQASEIDPGVPKIRVGVRSDAKPFSYRKEVYVPGGERILGAFGGYSIEICRAVLRKMLDSAHAERFEVESVVTDAGNRFEMLENGSIDMLCGPDSITSDRLAKYQVSFPMFLSGMSYAYLNPASTLFPRSNYCGNVIGVVNGTTAETDGLRDLARSDLLMRFDEALDLELSLDAHRLDEVGQMLREAIRESRQFVNGWPPASASNTAMQATIDSIDNRTVGSLQGVIQRRHARINSVMAQKIKTQECPEGFVGLPVRRYPGHEDGIARFCKGEVIYYLGDYDIIRSKVEEISGCDVVLSRFTRTREIYGVFFRRPDTASSDRPFACPSRRCVLRPIEGIDQCDLRKVRTARQCGGLSSDVSARLYADFNNTLFEFMQGDVSRVEDIFVREFGEASMSKDLKRFFASFKILVSPGPSSD